jgi:hypothetical protein
MHVVPREQHLFEGVDRFLVEPLARFIAELLSHLPCRLNHLVKLVLAVLDAAVGIYSVTVQIEVPPGGADGVHISQGGAFAGWALYLYETGPPGPRASRSPPRPV